jgi:protein TonB
VSVEPEQVPGTAAVVERVDNQIYSTAGVRVKPSFQEESKQFYIWGWYQTPERRTKGKVYITFV